MTSPFTRKKHASRTKLLAHVLQSHQLKTRQDKSGFSIWVRSIWLSFLASALDLSLLLMRPVITDLPTLRQFR